MTKIISSWHVGIAAEAYAAALFARCGYDVSVQYGANQPEYDLIVVSDDKMLKISVKGSQDGSWGLTQGHKKGNSYHEAADIWLDKHHRGTIFCLVQFKDVELDQLPRIYLATPEEIAQRMKDSAGGRGETILYENHTWSERAVGSGTTDKVPDAWNFSIERMQGLMSSFGV